VLHRSVEPAQYTSGDFAKYCKEHNVRRSLGRTGICYDNAVSESAFASYKKELIQTRPWPDLKTLAAATADWVDNYFNTVRRHSYLGYLTPREYELGYTEITQLAA
jgi:putative transposase